MEHGDSQEISRPIWDTTVYCLQQPTVEPILNQTNPVHIVRPCFTLQGAS
jgi:hypothetical protein